jgi:GrpB-like predicted nucleotidyltransferase (UPF0157 family)
MAKMKAHRSYELQEYNSEWKRRFLEAQKILEPIFGGNLVELDHVGSTSIEGMVAKSQVDILAVVKDLDLVKDGYRDFARVGFVSRGRGYVAADDEYLTKDSPEGRRLVSVHTLQKGNPKIAEYKMFRDYLKVNKKDRQFYIKTKRELYSKHHDNYAGYDSGKKEAIDAIKARAREWIRKNSLL